MKSSEDEMTLKQWFDHMRQWVLACPVFDSSPHVYVGALGESRKECLVCEKVIMEEVDEHEKELDKRISESLSWMDEEEK